MSAGSTVIAAASTYRRGSSHPPSSWLTFTGSWSVAHRSVTELTEYLAREGGHIGYAVVPEHRRRGYATEILRQSLVIARAAGVDRVLVTCDDDNVGSATVIERCGGVFDSLVARSGDGTLCRRYWID